jgi:HK97 family phage portal protein
MVAGARGAHSGCVGALERIGLRAAAGEVIPDPPRARQLGARIPVVRSGTPLEVAELSWIAEGVSRDAALSIPAVTACRNLIVGTVVQLDLYRYRAGERLEPDYLVTKPDPSTTLPATIGGTVDDLLFRGRAYWRVLERDPEGYPRRARWTPVDDVTPQSKSLGGSYSVLEGYRIAGLRDVLPVEDVIRFDSPIPGVLDTGARTLSAALELELAARRFAGVELPAGTLTNESGVSLSDEEAEAYLASFAERRRKYGLAWLEGVKYEKQALDPAELQLVEARANVATDVARLFNVPVAMIGASPSGNASALLYANLSQQLSLLLVDAVAPHLATIEATLTDATPRGQAVSFDVQTFLRSDPQAAAEYATGLLAAGIVDRDEARSMLGIPATSSTDLTPGRV